MKEFQNERQKIRYYHSLSGASKMEAFRGMLSESDHIAFLGGAGAVCRDGSLYPQTVPPDHKPSPFTMLRAGKNMLRRFFNSTSIFRLYHDPR